MTIAYNQDVATSRGVGNFVRLLRRWKGSIYKLVYTDLIVYFICYTIICLVYRLQLVYDRDHRRRFELIARYCSKYNEAVPASLVLSFYVSQIVTRWWTQWMICPWPDNLSILIATHVQGHGERSRLMRRTIMRYVNLSFTLTMIMMSPQVKSRFPTLDHLVEAGFLMPHEKIVIEHLNQKSDYSKYWIPLIWAGSVSNRARKEGRIADDIAHDQIVRGICKFRTGLGDLLSYDWVNIPLVYTQVVTLAVYLYFLAALVGKQQIVNPDTDVFFPVFLFIEFFFYMGWLKVAETMANPWGEDDDDFEVNWVIDRNFCVAYMIVDEMHAEHPEMLKDTYWDDVVPEDLPYTEATIKYKKATHGGSTENDKDREEKSERAPNDNQTMASAKTRSGVFRNKNSTLKANASGKDVQGDPQKAGSDSIKGSKTSFSSGRSGKEYKVYMDNTYVPYNKDEELNF